MAVLVQSAAAHSCTLPSFRDFCEGIPSSPTSLLSEAYQLHQECRRPSLASTMSDGGLPDTFKCPYAQCCTEPDGFTRLDKCINHVQQQHPHLLGDAVRVERTGRRDPQQTPRPAYGRLDSPVSSPTDDINSKDRAASLPSSPLQRGWFDPSTKRAVATISFVDTWTRDELHDAYWKTDPSRPLYGDQPTFNKKGPSDKVVDGVQPLHRGGKKSHAESERDRRVRHFAYQGELHHAQPEVTQQLADQDEEMQQIKQSTSSKGPGKDDQFVSDIYMHNLSALVVQSEHEGRKKAEREVEELKRQNLALRRSLFGESPSRKRHAGRITTEGVSSSKRQRTSDNESWEGSKKKRALRLPPSPSPSPSIASNHVRL
jgi:hypothetical protein